MTTAKKKRTTKPKIKKVEVVVEEVQEPEPPPTPKQFQVQIYKTEATKDKTHIIGYLAFSEQQQKVIFGGTPASANEISNFVSLSYYIDGILFSPSTRDWWDNLSKSSIIPSSWTVDFNQQTVMDEI